MQKLHYSYLYTASKLGTGVLNPYKNEIYKTDEYMSILQKLVFLIYTTGR